jgi:hypothetical protein
MHLTSACGADIKKSERKGNKKELLYYEVKRKLCERCELPISRKKEKLKFGVTANGSSYTARNPKRRGCDT